jgi:hypothetical protein
MKYNSLAYLACLIACSAFGQGAGITPTAGWVDPALNHNSLLQQKNGDGVYKLIGTYKVIGNCFLFEERLKGDIFSPDEKGYNISLSYNTYNQQVEFYSTANPDKALVKQPGDVDSFIIHENIEMGITTPLKFVYGSILSTSDKAYYQELYSGKRFSLYKKYKSELDYVSTNYIQSELRQFNLSYDYYYYDSQKRQLKKLKKNSSGITKEFKDVKDLSPVIDDKTFDVDPESVMKKAFSYLNS